MPSIDPHIFRAYDIRGIALSQLTADACEQIGRGFGSVLQELYGQGKADYHPTVIVGRDARTHSPELESALIAGLKKAGCAVQNIGQTPSPVNYFTICNRKTDAGVQITASHNPKEDNGIKLQIRSAESHSGDDLQKLRQRIEAQTFFSGTGTEEEIDGINPYMEYIVTLFGQIGAGKKIVVDAGNGVAGPVNVGVLRRVGCEVVELYTDPDGTFPNHPADPSKYATLKDLQAKVKEVGAICGFAYDGDGDRMGLVDEKGAICTADQVLLLLAQDHLQRHAGAPVIFTVSNSGTLETEIKKWGGTPIMSKVGHSFVEHAMHEHHALLGGEQSGHFFCGEGYFGFDDALVASLHVLQILSRSNISLSEMIAAFPHVFQAHERRPFCPDDKKKQIVEKITQHFSKTHPVITLDGARIHFGDGAWAGIRFSNTSPCLSVCIEARSAEKLAQVEKEIIDQLKTYAEVDLERH